MDTRFFLLGRSNGNKCPQPPSQVWSLYVRQKSSFDLGIDRIPISRPVSDRMAGDYVYVRQFLSYSIWIFRLRLMVGFKKKEFTILTYLNFSFCSILCVLFSKKNICWLRCWFLREGYFLIFLLPSAYVNNWLSLLPPAPKSHYQVHQIKTLNIDYNV